MNEFADVLVFKTDIGSKTDFETINNVLHQERRIKKWNIDHEDIDHVLRIESGEITPTEVIQLIRTLGYACEELPE